VTSDHWHPTTHLASLRLARLALLQLYCFLLTVNAAMSRISSLPSQIPILPLYEPAVLFPGQHLRLRVTSKSSSFALLSHILRSGHSTLVNLVLGCVPVRPGAPGIAEIVSEQGSRPALPAPPSAPATDTPPRKAREPADKLPESEHEFGCTARIKNITRLDRSIGTSGFVLVVEVEGMQLCHHSLLLDGLTVAGC